MLYQLAREISTLSISVFFRKVVVSGIENIPDKGPLIIVANHPNTFMDPLIIASITKQRIGFVANAGIFRNRIMAAIFRYFHVIPIYRKIDVPEGAVPDNTESFRECFEYLGEAGTLLIFPEGTSHYELKLRDIKTGTARIALNFESQNHFKANLKILPVALDYSDSIQFRSHVSVTVNTAIDVSDYKEKFSSGDIAGIKELTERIRSVLARNIPQTTSKVQEKFLLKAHRFYTAYYEPEADLNENPKRSLELRKQLSQALHYIEKYHPEIYSETQIKITEFFRGLKSEHISTGFYTDKFLNKNKFLVCMSYILEFILLLPFYIAGLVTNYIPYILPSRIFEALKIDISYRGPVQMVTGLITFPVYYFLLLFLFRKYISSETWLLFTLLFIFPATGYIAMYYWTQLRRFARIIRFYFYIPQPNKKRMLELRDLILEKIENARNNLL